VDRCCVGEGDEYCEWDVTWSEPEPVRWVRGRIEHLAGQILRKEIEAREKVINEQFRSLEVRHEELHQAYVGQQQSTADLQHRVDQLTTFHEAGLAFTSTLKQEALIEIALKPLSKREGRWPLNKPVWHGLLSYLWVPILCFGISGCTFLAKLSDELLNPVSSPGPYRDKIQEENLEFHNNLFVADLHADSLQWNRGLLRETPAEIGHVDLPRLLEGNIALQGFSVFTKIPLPYIRVFSRPFFSFFYSDYSPDVASLLALVQFRSEDYRNSLMVRALEQAQRLHELDEHAGQQFTIIKSPEDLSDFIQRRKTNSHMTAGFLSLEGAHALEGDIQNVEVLFTAGYRIIALVHFFDNEFAGSSTGSERQGLTPKGKLLIKKMIQHKVILDLAHASEKTLDDVLAMDRLPPLVVSHTGIRGTCPRGGRNLSDRHIRLIAQKGGVIGVGLWKKAVCGPSVDKTVQAINYARDLMDGVDNIAMGSDFDGAVRTHFDSRGMPLLVQALRRGEFSETQVGKIMGGNLTSFLLNHLPPEKNTSPLSTREVQSLVPC